MLHPPGRSVWIEASRTRCSTQRLDENSKHATTPLIEIIELDPYKPSGLKGVATRDFSLSYCACPILTGSAKQDNHYRGRPAMDVKLSRRQFFKVCASGMGGSSLAALGFAPTAALAEVREFKLLRTTETRNTCPYFSVSCGIIMYS